MADLTYVAVVDLTLDRQAVPHDQNAACFTHAHCLTHQVDELDRPGDYRVCGECGHIFRTEHELLDAESNLLAVWRMSLPARERHTVPTPATSGAAVLSCPYCTHDW